MTAGFSRAYASTLGRLRVAGGVHRVSVDRSAPTSRQRRESGGQCTMKESPFRRVGQVRRRLRFSARCWLGTAAATRSRTLFRLAGQGTTGSIRAEGWVLSWRMVFVAVTHLAEFAAGSPVLRLRSKRGKLLLESSSRRR